MPPVLSSGEEEHVVKTGIGGVAIAQGLESFGVGSSVEYDIAWTGGIGILVSGDNDCNLVGNREVVTAFIPNAVKPYRQVFRITLAKEFMGMTIDGGIWV
jgi:hypothetical protein